MTYTTKAQIEALKALDKGERVWYGQTDGGYMLGDKYSFVCIPESLWYLDKDRLHGAQSIAEAQRRNGADATPAELTEHVKLSGKRRLRVFKTQEGEKLLDDKFLRLAPVVSWSYRQSCLYGLDCEGRLVCGAMITTEREEARHDTA